MPDPIVEARRKEEFMKNRAGRILQLSREWGVPTSAIFSQSKWGYSPATATPDQITYFTLKNNAVTNQKIDYGPVKGYPAGVYLPENKISAIKTDSTGKILPAIKNGGKIIRKAQYGEIIPIGRKRNISSELENIPSRPYQTIDPAISAYFNNPENKKYIPANATLQGPEPGNPQYLLNTENGQISADPSFPDNGSKATHVKAGFQIPQLNLNTAPLITGIAGAINNLYDRQAGQNEFNRLKRKQLQTTGYNPYMHGTGSQAIMKNGGRVTPLSNNGPSSMVEFKGPSHEEGGIPISYDGTRVEVEGGEPAYIDKQGDLNIFGNLNVPGTGKKFKQIAKLIGKHEASAIKKLEKSAIAMGSNDQQDKFEMLKYNSANLQSVAASNDLAQLSYLKDRLSALQERELLSSGNYQSDKAQDGKKVRKPSMAERHNNPGNIKYAPWLAKKFGAKQGDRATDGGNFAVFPNKETGLTAMKTLLKGPGYKSRTVEDAIKRWTNSEGYKQDAGTLKGRKVGELNDADLKNLINHITTGEDSKLYDLDFLFTGRPKDPVIDASIHPPQMPVAGQPTIPGKYTNDPGPGINPPGKKTVPIPDLPELYPPNGSKPPVRNPLGISQIGPELLALIDRPDFVPGQRYEPDLFSPYQVSFQDRLNENQASFNRASMSADNNSAAASVLAGQKYLADSGVLADQFRTNQGTTNDITNKNIALLNDAQLKNLQLADTQFTRQTQAVANTRQNIYNAVSSLAAKIGQNRLETKSYNAVSSLYPQYEFNDRGSLNFLPDNNLSFGGNNESANIDYYQRQRMEYDGNGNLKKMVENTPSGAEQAKMDYYLWNQMMKKKNAMLAKPSYIHR